MALIDNKVIKNYMLFKVVKRLKIPYRQKERLYLLITILGDLISYKNEVIYIEIERVELRIKGWRVIINFNILLLKKDKAVLGMP